MNAGREDARARAPRPILQLPVENGESLDLFLRYESAAERTLSRSLESIVRIREGLDDASLLIDKRKG
jgi:hypothetical protein